MYTRECTKCKIQFPATTEYFHKSNTSKYGIHSRCKTCKINLEKDRRLKDPKKSKDMDLFYRNKYKSKRAISIKEYSQKNKEKINNNRKNRYKNNLNYKIKCILRSRFFGVIKHKYQSSLDFGCSIEELIIHIQSQFVDGMTWENHGVFGWHIDHIIPCCSFDLTDPQQQRECFHYSNLQPLWAEDNLKKNGKYLQ